MTATFAEFGLAAPLARALDGAGFVTPTPIQAQAIPHLIAGKDLLGLAQTGTGKTAAFVLPILQRVRAAGTRPEAHTTRALILAPTRELAIQIHDTIKTLSKGQHFAHASVFGGVSINPQIDQLRRGLDILVATPGRLVDLIQQKQVKFSATQYFVLDEADRMLDMGFIRDIRRIVALLPKERQSMLFSATMPAEISDIAAGLLKDPVTVEVRAEVVPIDRIDQRLVHLPVGAKRDALLKLLSGRDVTRAMVFARTKHGANRLCDHLVEYGLNAVVIHGNKSQGARQKALGEFKSGEAKILVATDIAARGIDVADVSHVVNAELPDEPEAYVHRIGRTARAGRSGVAFTLCAPEEKDKLKAVEKLLKRAIPVVTIEGVDLSKATGARISDVREPRGQRGRGARPDRERLGRRGEERRTEGGRDERARDDRPRDDAPRQEAPRREARPQRQHEERTHQGRPHQDRPRQDRPRSDRPREERSWADRPWSNEPRDDRPRADRHYGERQDQRRDDRPQRAYDDRPRQGQARFGDEARAPRQDKPPRQEQPRGERKGLLPGFIERGAPRGERRDERGDNRRDGARPAGKGRRFG